MRYGFSMIRHFYLDSKLYFRQSLCTIPQWALYDIIIMTMKTSLLNSRTRILIFRVLEKRKPLEEDDRMTVIRKTSEKNIYTR